MKNKYLFGVLVVLAGGAFLSTSGILVRNMDNPDGWQIVFFRSFAFVITIMLLMAYRYGRNIRIACSAIGNQGILCGIILGLGSVCYVFAIIHTTVANVVFIIGSAPLITALLGWVFLKEKIPLWGLVAMLFAFLGIGLMFLDGLISGGMIGNILAFGVVLSFSIYLLLLRNNKHLDMVPATGLAGFVTFIIAAIMIPNFVMSGKDLLICLALGSFQFGLGFICMTIGSKYVPAAEVALFALSESILNPLWVWIGVGEVPGTYALYGSGVVLISVIAYSLMAIRSERQLQSQSHG